MLGGGGEQERGKRWIGEGKLVRSNCWEKGGGIVKNFHSFSLESPPSLNSPAHPQRQ